MFTKNVKACFYYVTVGLTRDDQRIRLIICVFCAITIGANLHSVIAYAIRIVITIYWSDKTVKKNQYCKLHIIHILMLFLTQSVTKIKIIFNREFFYQRLSLLNSQTFLLVIAESYNCKMELLICKVLVVYTININKICHLFNKGII